jgi:hypothetical protein
MLAACPGTLASLGSRFNFAREIFYIGPLNVPKRDPRDICIIIIKFTSISGHVEYLFHFLQPSQP